MIIIWQIIKPINLPTFFYLDQLFIHPIHTLKNMFGWRVANTWWMQYENTQQKHICMYVCIREVGSGIYVIVKLLSLELPRVFHVFASNLNSSSCFYFIFINYPHYFSLLTSSITIAYIIINYNLSITFIL